MNITRYYSFVKLVATATDKKNSKSRKHYIQQVLDLDLK